MGGSRLNHTREVTLSTLISTPRSVSHHKREVTIEEVPKTMFPERHEGQKQLEKHIVFTHPTFILLFLQIDPVQFVVLTSPFSLLQIRGITRG